MTGWLLDTNVLSAFAPGRPAIPNAALRWFEQRMDGLFISAISAAEIGEGVAKLRRAGQERRASAFEAWFDQILTLYGERVLSFDLPAARLAGKLGDAARARGRHPGFPDVAIAAIAVSRDLVVATLNTRHFSDLGVPLIDPLGGMQGISPVHDEEHGGD